MPMVKILLVQKLSNLIHKNLAKVVKEKKDISAPVLEIANKTYKDILHHSAL